MLPLVLFATLVTASQAPADTAVEPSEAIAPAGDEEASPLLNAPPEGPGEEAPREAPEAEVPSETSPPAEAAAPPMPPAPPPVAEVAPPRVVTPEGDPVSTEPPGMGPFMTRVLQIGAGCGLTALSGACCAIPWVGAPAVACLGPAIVTTTHVTIAETFGAGRGTLVWPLLTAYAIETVTLLGSAGALIGTAAAIGAGGPELFQNIGSATDPSVAIAAAFGALLIPFAAAGAVLLVGGLLMVTGSALVYGWTSTTKEPSDSDFRFPGLCSPNLPDAVADGAEAEDAPEEARHLPRGTRVAEAMAF